MNSRHHEYCIMSLFPAYAEDIACKVLVSGDQQWLSNSSYCGPSSSNQKKEQHKNQVKEENKYLHGVKKYNKKKKKRKRKKKIDDIEIDCDLYCVDKIRRHVYLKYETLMKKMVPRYFRKNKKNLGCASKKYKYRVPKRYFTPGKRSKIKTAPGKLKQLKRKSEEFNKSLNQNSSVAEWIEFVKFQDNFFQQPSFNYSSGSDKKRALMKKKLDIIEKAMSYNPYDEDLLKIWLTIGTEICSPDELHQKMQSMLQQHPDNTSLWFSLIFIRQQSLALCTFSSVTDLYQKAISGIRNIRTRKIIDNDSDFLGLLFHYCRFLDQCGHWEILWTILSKNIQLNLGIGINSSNYDVDDARVKKMEDEIVSVRGQPIWVTWRRLELYRERVHFMPVSESKDFPQRCVFTRDIVDFVFHFHKDLHFRFIIICILILKVPLLSSNSTILKYLCKNILAWPVDMPELILSSVVHSPAADIKVLHLKHLTQIIRGPQYLRYMEGQPEFLELIQNTFKEFINILKGKQKIAVAIWWLRFNSWLCMLEKHSLASLQDYSRKTKALFKDFMKIEENRNNLLYYCEYGLFEFNQGNTESSIKTLRTLINSRPSAQELTDDIDKAGVYHACRCLSEIYLAKHQTENAVKVLVNFGAGNAIDSEITNHTKLVALNKYEKIAMELIEQMQESSASLEDFFLPQITLEWIICCMWLLGLTKSTISSQTFMQEVCAKLQNCDTTFATYVREELSEALCVIYWTLQRNDELVLSQVFKEASNQFPFNLKILSLISTKKLNDHGFWWTFKQPFLDAHSMFGNLMLICVALERYESDKEGFCNRVKSLFQQVTENDGKLSSVIHCLRLKFLFDSDNALLGSAEVNAIESCPWNKNVYMGAIAVLPNKLMEFTDIMIEKELRVHVTPDEVHEMRD